MTEETPQFYNTTKVAEMFSVSNYTVRKWIKEGKLHAVQINGRWKVRHDEILRLGRERHG